MIARLLDIIKGKQYQTYRFFTCLPTFLMGWRVRGWLSCCICATAWLVCASKMD